MADWLDPMLAGLSAEERLNLEQARTQGIKPLEFLAARRLVPAEKLLDEASSHYRIPALTLAAFHPEEEATALLPEEMARRHQMLPLFVLENQFYVAVSDPEDLTGQDFVEQLTGLSVWPVLALKPDLEQALNRVYLTTERAGRALKEIARDQEPEPIDWQAELAILEDREAPAVRMVDRILQQAVHLRASDVHLEVYAHRTELRYRVDGVLHDFPPPPAALYPAIVSRIKISARMDIAERRLPQDGRFTVEVGGRDYDLRVAVIPTIQGEGVVIRLLNPGQGDRRLEDLGFEPAMQARFEALARRPNGILLVTGPTGSGKTTTLYATLRHIFTPRRKFITLEDPVEMQLDGVTQVQIRPEIGLGFAEGLRSVLRYDPDVVLVGEIRDAESAEIAIRASLTGHLLLSTLHTNDAPQALVRLVDMGIAPYKILASLAGVLAQRLIRVLCPTCKQPTDPTPAELSALNLTALPEGATLCRARGCPECGGIGYRGRVALYELLEVTPSMRRLRDREITPETLRNLARERGFTSLRHSALNKLFQGITGVDEVLDLTAEE